MSSMGQIEPNFQIAYPAMFFHFLVNFEIGFQNQY